MVIGFQFPTGRSVAPGRTAADAAATIRANGKLHSALWEF